MTTRITNSSITACAARREPFTNANGSCTARVVAPGHHVSVGSLPPEYVEALREAAGAGDVYVVFSYATPIGWAAQGQDMLTVPDVRYSSTTTRHQHALLGGRLASDTWDWITIGESLSIGDAGRVRKGKGKSPYGARAGY